jgi:hypothetical protein
VKYWVNVISKDHVIRGVKGGFTQANHGSANNLKQVGKGDYIIFYSPKETYEGTQLLQMFTAVGKVTDEQPHQFAMDKNFRPFRRKMDFLDCTELPIRPLLDDLELITDKQHWGYPFRRGLFAISEHDFLLVARQMGLRL